MHKWKFIGKLNPTTLVCMKNLRPEFCKMLKVYGVGKNLPAPGYPKSIIPPIMPDLIL